MTVYAIEDKTNTHVEDDPVTAYTVRIWNKEQQAFVHAGRGYAPGHECTDQECWDDWLSWFPKFPGDPEPPF